jgi:tRNA G18 (ribose-2'-O)-methylase SpoU
MNEQTSGKSEDFAVLMQRDVSPQRSESEPASCYGGLGLELVLCGLQSPVNIGIILRVAEAFQFKVSILDPHDLLDDPQKLSTIRDFACGAMSRRGFQRLENPSALERLRCGRRFIATSIGRNAQPLSSFHFLPGDLIALGNEYDGLPDEVVATADTLLHVPTPAVWIPKEKSHSPIDPVRTAPVAHDGQPSLNVAVTAGILCYAAYGEWLANV